MIISSTSAGIVIRLVLPSGLEGYDAAQYLNGALPIFGGIGLSSFAHEMGHQVAGNIRKIKLSLPFLIPNGQLGTFGSVTQIKSLPENRSDMFDVAIAGQGLTLVHISAQPEPFLSQNTPLRPPDTSQRPPKYSLKAPPIPHKALTLS